MPRKGMPITREWPAWTIQRNKHKKAAVNLYGLQQHLFLHHLFLIDFNIFFCILYFFFTGQVDTGYWLCAGNICPSSSIMFFNRLSFISGSFNILLHVPTSFKLFLGNSIQNNTISVLIIYPAGGKSNMLQKNCITGLNMGYLFDKHKQT
jgi:hypothetical protein